MEFKLELDFMSIVNWAPTLWQVHLVSLLKSIILKKAPPPNPKQTNILTNKQKQLQKPQTPFLWSLPSIQLLKLIFLKKGKKKNNNKKTNSR